MLWTGTIPAGSFDLVLMRWSVEQVNVKMRYFSPSKTGRIPNGDN
jgi:hypothetical protein